MNNELVLRLITLVSKNGDRIVLADPSTGKGVVVMDLDSYERLNAALDEVQAPQSVAPVLPTEVPPQALPQPQASQQASRFATYAEEVRKNYAEEVRTPAPAAVQPSQQPARAEARPTVRYEEPEAPPRRGPGRPRRQTSSFENGPATQELADLTQEDLLDKINRDIGAWKNAKDRLPPEETRNVAQKNPYMGGADALEDEEKFYLEPIE
jgi:hypothetical protein